MNHLFFVFITRETLINNYIDVYDSVFVNDTTEERVLGGKGIPNGKLYFRFDHRRDAKTGVLLSNGIMEYKMTELMKADPFGIGGMVDVGDEIKAGNVLILHSP